MKAQCDLLNYDETSYFSPLVIDYLHEAENLKNFYLHAPGMEGIKASIAARKKFNQPRQLLADALTKQYADLDINNKITANLQALLRPTTFTITTAHQPNILTGPLYFIYKILHAIKLAATLKNIFNEYDFVPVYYMGSEDADLDELGHIFLNGEKVEWQTGQVGAVGRMHTNGIENLIDRLEGEFGNRLFGAEMLALCRKAYQPGNNVQQATLVLVNELFKAYGLLVVVPDNALLKSAFNEVVKKELTTQFSYPLVQETIADLDGHYKVQAGGRAINLFYLSDDGSRDRIELKKTPVGKAEPNTGSTSREFVVLNKGITFSVESILQELDTHPERFSANVILRGVFQETILPNIAFIGGGGELAYWLELKKVFEATGVPYPVLLLRNSFLLIPPAAQQLQNKLNLDTKTLFRKTDLLINQLVLRNASHKLNTGSEQEIINELYKNLQEQASNIDPTLKAHVAALHVRTLQGLVGLEKKFLRAEKRKHAADTTQVLKLKNTLFPNNNLQERVENFLPFFATYGPAILDLLYEYSQPIAENFAILHLEE